LIGVDVVEMEMLDLVIRLSVVGLFVPAIPANKVVVVMNAPM
tara:strand:- start:200 stop:325 length:126 start_codon:yes stop_codon:yes gene_type:complete